MALKQFKYITLKDIWLSTGIVILMFLPGRCLSQQDPLYTQYMFNTLAINPAYAGTRDVLSLMLLSRHQWVGFDGAPSTQTFTANSPIANKNIGLGLSVMYDKIGPTRQTGIYMDYSFQLKFSKGSKLSFGLKGGGNFYQLDMTELKKVSPYEDPAYTIPNVNKFLPNFGVGIYYYSRTFYFGASIPKLLENKLADGQVETYQGGKEVRHYYLMTGAIINISKNVKFKPSVMARLTAATPSAIDLNANFLFVDRVWVGAMYRISDSFGGIVQFLFTPQFRIGYAYEMSTGELQDYNKGTHEIMLNYEFNFKKYKVQNPRYF